MTEAEGEPSAAPRPYVRCAAIHLLRCLSHPLTGGTGRSQDHGNSDVHLEGEQVSLKSWALHSVLCRQGLRGWDFGAQLRETKVDSKEQTPFTLPTRLQGD